MVIFSLRLQGFIGVGWLTGFLNHQQYSLEIVGNKSNTPERFNSDLAMQKWWLEDFHHSVLVVLKVRHLGHWEREKNPIRGLTITMLMNHLVVGIILQVKEACVCFRFDPDSISWD